MMRRAYPQLSVSTIAVILSFCLAAANAQCSSKNRKIVEDMYMQALSRRPDSGGLRSYCRNLANGRSVKSQFMAIVKSREYRQKFVDNCSDFFAAANLYKVTLNRCPDPNGLLGKVNRIRTRGITNTIDTFFRSREYRRKCGNDRVPNSKPGRCDGRPADITGPPGGPNCIGGRL